MSHIFIEKTIEGWWVFYVGAVGVVLAAILTTVWTIFKNTIRGNQKIEGMGADLERLVEMQESAEREDKLQTETLKALTHGRICKDALRAIKRGYITERELQNLEAYFKPYIALGGNGLAKNYMRECRQLPIRESVREQADTEEE